MILLEIKQVLRALERDAYVDALANNWILALQQAKYMEAPNIVDPTPASVC